MKRSICMNIFSEKSNLSLQPVDLRKYIKTSLWKLKAPIVHWLGVVWMGLCLRLRRYMRCAIVPGKIMSRSSADPSSSRSSRSDESCEYHIFRNIYSGRLFSHQNARYNKQQLQLSIQSLSANFLNWYLYSKEFMLNKDQFVWIHEDKQIN